jgi:hypothetical protein
LRPTLKLVEMVLPLALTTESPLFVGILSSEKLRTFSIGGVERTALSGGVELPRSVCPALSPYFPLLTLESLPTDLLSLCRDLVNKRFPLVVHHRRELGWATAGTCPEDCPHQGARCAMRQRRLWEPAIFRPRGVIPRREGSRLSPLVSLLRSPCAHHDMPGRRLAIGPCILGRTIRVRLVSRREKRCASNLSALSAGSGRPRMAV